MALEKVDNKTVKRVKVSTTEETLSLAEIKEKLKQLKGKKAIFEAGIKAVQADIDDLKAVLAEAKDSLGMVDAVE